MPKVHATAVVDPKAWLDEDVEVGPYCVVSGGAVIGRGTKLVSHVIVSGEVRIGTDNVVFPFCAIGAEPQDLGYDGSPTWVVIGNNNVIRESCTIHRATTKESGVTSVGSNNFLMCGVHVGHDVSMGSHVVIANNTLISGHVHIHDYAGISGAVGIHQFATVGSYCFIGGMSRVPTDVPPYMLVEGSPMEIRCVNAIGLKRRGFTHDEIRSLTQAHRLLYRLHVPLETAKEDLVRSGQYTDSVSRLFEFLDSQRGGMLGRGREGRKAA
jgi:UDP-N-acetylglucosamine acyltransferase